MQEKKINIIKRDGTQEPLNIDKIHAMIVWACKDLDGVSVSELEIKSKLQFYNGMKTSMIHSITVKTAADLITEKNPNYQYVAARLLLMDLRKKVYNSFTPRPLLETMKINSSTNRYDKAIFDFYTDREIEEFGEYINYDRDYDFTYAGIRQCIDKYLVQNRKTKQYFETIQDMFMLIPMYIFAEEKPIYRKKLIKQFYDALSTHKISLATPIIAGVRTKLKQFASCCVIDVDDTMEGIIAADSVAGRYTAKRAGIGFNIRIRGEDAEIKGGELKHTGIIPFLKKLEATTKSCQQAGLRGGSSTSYFWSHHWEMFENILELKNNKGTDDRRVKQMDYGFSMNKLLLDSAANNEDYYLFSNEQVLPLYEAFHSEDYSNYLKLYNYYKVNELIRKKEVSAKELLNKFLCERFETGRIYPFFADNINTQGMFKDNIYSSNLCVSGDTIITILHNTVDIPLQIKIKDLQHFLDSYSNIKVLSYNIEYDKIMFSTITNFAMTNQNAEVIKLTCECLNGYKHELILTKDHKIWTKNRGYIEVSELQFGDFMMISNGEYTDKFSLTSIIDKEPVYDITVENTHNFFANNILVHNCTEIMLPTSPINHIDDTDGEVAMCILSNINLGRLKNLDEIEILSKLLVRFLDNIIDYQQYPIKAAEISTKNRRSIGIGFSDVFHFLAKNKVKYNSKDGLELIHKACENLSFYSISASVELAKEKGRCNWFDKTKWSEGVLPIDTYNKNVDKITPNRLTLPWDELRKNIVLYGMRNSALLSIPPAANSAVVSNSTLGVDAPKKFMVAKENKQSGMVKQIIQGYPKLAQYYTLAWDIDNMEYIKFIAVMQKFIDQGISASLYYDPNKYENNNIPLGQLVRELYQGHKYGLKSIYYALTNDDTTEAEETDCAGGACKI